jgi:uncharacterized protein with NRDE domain
MCLLVLAWQSHPRYRLVVAANRDEFHERPASALGWWADEPRIVAGRDLRGSGSWMGASRTGRFAVVTNFRDLERAPTDAPSRGHLVADFLRADGTTIQDYLDALRVHAPRYAGFNLLLGDGAALSYFSNRGDAAPRPLPAGVYGLSNHTLDSPWPKLVRSRERMEELLAGDRVEPHTLFALLADRTPADLDETPDTGLPPDWERALSSPFVAHEHYGTRCSTVLLTGHDGRTTLCERRFDAQGALTGATRIEFMAAMPVAAMQRAVRP